MLDIADTAAIEVSKVQRARYAVWDAAQAKRWGPTRSEEYRSRARVCWHTARELRRYVIEHGWHLNQDDIDLSLEHAADLRKEAAEHVRTARRIQRGLL